MLRVPWTWEISTLFAAVIPFGDPHPYTKWQKIPCNMNGMR